MGWAQTTETTETDADAQTEEAAENTPREDGLSTGQLVDEIGKPYTLSEHGDWEVVCINAPDGQKDPCDLFQLLTDSEGTSVAEMRVFTLPGDDELAAGAAVAAPLGTLLNRQMQISVDGSQAKVYPFTFCSQQACFARIGLTSGDLAGMRAGNTLTVSIYPLRAPNQKVDLDFSLTGFTAGFEAVAAARAE